MSTLRDAIYLDANAGVLVHPRVGEALRAILQDEIFGANPSSVHVHGRKAKHLVLEARDRVARSLGALTNPDSLVFTSSGTEANQLVIRSVFEPILEAQINAKTRAHWITTPVEHDCNLQMIDWLKDRGGEVSLLPVDANGTPDVSKLSSLLRPETALVSAIWVSNETGVISPAVELARECLKASVPLHLDGAQAWGKIPVNLDELAKQGLTYAAFAPHKIGGLAGTGVLWSKKGARIISQIRGQQQANRRGGTENLLGIYAAGVAALQTDASEQNELTLIRDRLQKQIQSRIEGTLVNGGSAPRISGTLSLCFEGIERDGLVQALDLEGFSVSSGSACSSGVTEPSHVLQALGRSEGLARAGLRISIPSGTDWESLESFVTTLEVIVHRMRKSSHAKTLSAVN